ncbi:MAG TPA: tRNA lysidine(34) synthetase TilS [Ramlibacter sp.]|nr:tRNA lysidine(34) synthetase TilS [Ramlibacter sp.]
MAASPTPKPTAADLPPSLRAALRGRAPDAPFAVALSGGADSTALLLAATWIAPTYVHAIHVNHGLQSAADSFEQRCAQLCGELGVPLHVARVDARRAPGESPEDIARRARYTALASMARQEGLREVWLAQHADDQVETVLLALSRGAGLPGLAAMAPAFERAGVKFERPLLDVPGAALREWLTGQGVPWVEDPTNEDAGFTRNRIRQVVMPALASAFPAFRETFARSARHAAQAQQLLAGMAEADLAAMGGEPDIAQLQALPAARQANVLRHWLREAHAAQPSAAQLDELLAQVRDCRTRGHAIRIRAATGLVERDGARLTYTPSV